MSVTVERLYRIRIGNRPLTLDGEQALGLTKGLLTALGLAPIDAAPHPPEHLGEATVASPAALPSGPVAGDPEPPPSRPPVVKGAERDRIVAEERSRGDGWAERAAERCGVTTAAIYLHAKKAAAKAATEAAPHAPRSPAPASPSPAPDDWTDPQSRLLVDLMTRPNASLQYATTCCGHSFVATSKKWSALKAAGITSVAEWDRRHAGASEAAG